MDGDGEAAEIERLRAEIAGLRAEVASLRDESDALRIRCAELIGAEMALQCLLEEARESRGGRRSLSREQVKLLGDPTAGSA